MNGGRKLQTLADVRAYALTLPQFERTDDHWLRALRLLKAAAEGGDLHRLRNAIVVATNRSDSLVSKPWDRYVSERLATIHRSEGR
jgi:hypothetical protein